MTTGARRGELCAIRRRDVDLDARILTIAHSVTELGRQEKDTKTHQQRRISLDAETVEILRAHIARLNEDAAALDIAPKRDAYLFSYSPTGDVPMHPSGVTHRYGKLVDRVNVNTTLHKLRHYNATELIAAGVDLRTIAGRLGHGGGGTTTLRVYAAWVSEADQRAAGAVASKLRKPKRR